jgi:WD40 repeat protein
MKYYEEDGILYLYNAPNSKLNATSTTAARNGYVQIVDPKTGEVSRTSFATSATEPIYKQSPDGKYFAIASREKRFSVIYTVQVYDRQTGDMISVFKNDIRLAEDTNIGRACFEFLPDHQTLVMGYGSKLALWKFLE